jgi:hypothetical protein
MTEIVLRALESTRRNFGLPPGVADARSGTLVAADGARRDYGLDVRAVREIRARMIIRASMYRLHRSMLRGQHR